MNFLFISSPPLKKLKFPPFPNDEFGEFFSIVKRNESSSSLGNESSGRRKCRREIRGQFDWMNIKFYWLMFGMKRQIDISTKRHTDIQTHTPRPESLRKQQEIESDWGHQTSLKTNSELVFFFEKISPTFDFHKQTNFQRKRKKIERKFHNFASVKNSQNFKGVGRNERREKQS